MHLVDDTYGECQYVNSADNNGIGSTEIQYLNLSRYKIPGLHGDVFMYICNHIYVNHII